MSFKLIATEGAQSYELRTGAPLVVGRAMTSDIPVLDPTISRRHAELLWDETGIHVRDLGSSNGTFLNGMRVESAKLSAGDIITFGKVAFRVKEVRADHPTPVREVSPLPPVSGTIVRRLPARESSPGGGLGTVLGPGIMAALRASGPQRPLDLGETTQGLDHAKSQHRLELLLQVSQALSRAVDVDPLLEKIVAFSFDIFDVDRVAIELLDEQDQLVPKVARDKRGAAAERAIPRSIARKAVEEKVAILSDNAGEDQRFGGQSIVMQRVRSAMCAPLIGSEDRVLGVLYVDNFTTTHRFDEGDLEFLIAFSGIAAVAIENSRFAERIRREMVVRSNFERYFAPKLAARIANSPEAMRLGGEKRKVAVLFSDIRGFTALSESMNPDDMAQLLSEYFTEMVDIVFRHEGNLDKFIGDAVMAQWGAPIASDEDADRAVRAAVEMLEALDQLNAKWRREGRPELQIGIGLNYGEAFAGYVGAESRLEFTVIGDTVNTASRLSTAAGAREILISDDLRRALIAPPPLAECPALELKGKSQPVPVYRVVV